MVHCPRLALAASLRSAWLISRACEPTCTSPISPSISACGTSAATLSTAITSTLELRTNRSTTSSAISPLSGCVRIMSRAFKPRLAAYTGSNACSASISATVPPLRCIAAIACSASVVLPLLSGP